MKNSRRVTSFIFVCALPSVATSACNDEAPAVREADADTWGGSDNSGWYSDEPDVDVDADFDVEIDTQTGDADADADADTSGPEVSDNSGWYADADDADADDATDTDTDVETDSTDAETGADAETGTDADADDSASLWLGLDWSALAWCAPERKPAGLRPYRGVRSPFTVDLENA